VKAKLHFMNVPVDEEPHENGVLRLLEAAASPNDFVVLKVDIYTPCVEVSIVEAIAREPHLARLVDEIFFEYHFTGEPPAFNFGWENQRGGHFRKTWWEWIFGRTLRGKCNPTPTVDDALRLMHKLRTRGVRAHFWI